MAVFPMKKALLFLMALMAGSVAKATVSIEIIAGQLTDFSGNVLQDGSYVSLFSLGTSGVFSPPTSVSFLSGTEQLISNFSLQSSTAGNTLGAFDQFVSGINVLLNTNLASGQQLAIAWYPTISASSLPAAPSVGTHYGFYTDPTWLIPADGGVVQYVMQTVVAGGLIPNIDGQATFTVAAGGGSGGGGAIPEPATYALLGGVAVLGLAVVRRRLHD
jgi:hypothetical protein